MQVSAFVSILATIYMRVFLKESVRQNDAITQPILKTGVNKCEYDNESSSKIKVFKTIPSPTDFVFLIKSRYDSSFIIPSTFKFFYSCPVYSLSSMLICYAYGISQWLKALIISSTVAVLS